MKLKFEPGAPIQVLFCVVLFSAESENFQNFWSKTMDYIVRHFGQMPFRTHNSLLEGATELNFVSFCSSLDALSDGILFH